MANGTFATIENILDNDTLIDSDAHRLLLAAILDINNKFDEWKLEDKKLQDSKDKKQDIINRKVEKMWYLYGVNIAVFVFFAAAFGRLVWSLITGEVNITYFE